MARKRKRRQGRAQLKVRLPEALRREIETAAARRGHSMNTEIVERLLVFDRTRDAKKLVAQALLDTLDDEIIDHIVDDVRQREHDDYLADQGMSQLDEDRYEAERDKE